MHTVRLGEIFAEASFFSGRYHCDALAIGDTEVLLYPTQELTRYLRDDPQALWTFAAELARRIQGLRTRLELKQIRSAPKRLLQFIRLRCDAAGSLPIDGSLMHLAEELGLTREALYRALATLEREGCINREPGKIRLRIVLSAE
jgi:CRP-like cAMP-binding protein